MQAVRRNMNLTPELNDERSEYGRTTRYALPLLTLRYRSVGGDTKQDAHAAVVDTRRNAHVCVRSLWV